MNDFDPLCLALSQETNHLEIRSRHLVKVQNFLCATAYDLFLHYRKMLRLNFADQPDRRCLPDRQSVDFQGHLVWLADDACTYHAIGK
jgi:hypothetical protein